MTTSRRRVGSIAGDGSSPASADSCSPLTRTSSPVKRKREQVATACEYCRMAKLRCDGKHPTCARCRDRGQSCTYDVAVEGLTRREYTRLQFEQQKQELERCTVVMDRLRQGTDKEAAGLLARLRIGDSVEQLYDCLVAGKEVMDCGERSMLSPLLDVKFEQGPGVRTLSSAAYGMPLSSSPDLSTGSSSPELSRQYSQGDTVMLSPIYRKSYRPEFFDSPFLSHQTQYLQDGEEHMTPC